MRAYSHQGNGPRADQTGRIHISDFRKTTHNYIAKRSRSIHSGHSPTSPPGWRMSALTPRTDLRPPPRHVCSGPEADIGLIRKRLPTVAALFGWRVRIKKLRNGCEELRWCERLRQHDAVRHPLGSPILGIVSAHVNDGKVRVDFSSMPCDVPTVEFSRPQIDVRDKRPVFAFGGIKQLNGIFAGRSQHSLESTIAQALFDDALNKLVVFNDQDQDKELVFQLGPQVRRNMSADVHAGMRLSFRNE